MSTNESDQLLELRDELNDEDEPLFAPPAAKATGAFPAASNPPGPATGAFGAATGAPAGKPGTAPPPLPPRRTGALPAAPVAVPPTPASGAIVDPLRARPVTRTIPPPGASPQRAKTATSPGVAQLPPTVARPPPGTDPFQEPPEPRLPAGADAEERLKTFRTIIKAKDEALARARALYGAVDNEAQLLRVSATAMKLQLEQAAGELARAAEFPQQIQLLKDMLEKDTVRADVAEKKMDDLVARLAEADAERKDLTNALAEVEQALRDANLRLEDERSTREQLADELIGAKEALSHAQDRIAELAAHTAEVEGNRGAFEEQAEQLSQECLTLSQKVSELEAELSAAVTARELLKGESDATLLELEALRQRSGTSEQQLGELTQKLAALESEHEWGKSTLEQSTARIAELEAAAAEAKQERDLSQQQLSTRLQQVSALEGQLTQAQLTATRLKGELDDATRGAQARVEALEAQLRETQTVARNQLGSLQQQLQTLQARSAHLESQLGEANARERALTEEHQVAAAATGQAHEAELAALRDQVATLQTSFAEASGNAEATQSALQSSDTRNNELEAEAVQLRAKNEQLTHRQGQLEARLKAAEEKATKLATTSQSESAELDEMRQAAELRAINAENRLKETLERVKAAETRAAQQEARASQAESRAKDLASKAGASTASDGKLKAAEARVAELEMKVSGLKVAEQELGHLQAQEIQLKLQVSQLTAELAAARDVDPDVTNPGLGGADAAELEKVKAENAAMKKKLMSAETAIEAAASLKSRVAKLEAQLKAAAAPPRK